MMAQTDFKSLSDLELLDAQKKSKKAYTALSIIFCLMIGVAIYSNIQRGFGFFSVYPLIFAPLLFGKYLQHKAIANEIKSRNLVG